MVGLLLMEMFGRTLAQDTPAGSEQLETEEARRSSDQAIVRFNTHIEDFLSWELFEAVVLARVTPDMMGSMLYVSGGYGACHYGIIAQDGEGHLVAEDGWQRMAADADRSHLYRVSVQRKRGGLIMDRRCQPAVFLLVY